jgi:selenide,water dikinase
MMSGALSVLNNARCALVGGHTSEAPAMSLGFTINGLDSAGPLMTKGGLLPGQALVLTKPLGTGTLMAARPRLLTRGDWVDNALAQMCQSSQQASDILRQHGAAACTDITGFGLLGHMLEMLRASNVNARLSLDKLPVLAGARETLAAGVESSLAPANGQYAAALRHSARDWQHPLRGLLFDPQTAGGLLAGIPAERAQACIAALHNAGFEAATCVGQVLEADHQSAVVELDQSDLIRERY